VPINGWNEADLRTANGGNFPTDTPTPTATNTPIGANTNTPTPTSTSTNVPTSTPTSTPTPTATPTPTSTSSVPPTATPTAVPNGDSFENDNSCAMAKPLNADGVAQEHTFHVPGDEDWVYFEAQAGETYYIEAITPPQSKADILLETFQACGSLPGIGQDPSFSPEIHLQMDMSLTGAYYLHLLHTNPTEGSPEHVYQLSVRKISGQGPKGAVIVVAGRLSYTDNLQQNIYNITDHAYNVFQNHGYNDSGIYYLSPDLNHNADSDPFIETDALSTASNLQSAITIWAAQINQGNPSPSLTIYMADHGSNNVFYLNTLSQVVTPDDLNTWLTELEGLRPQIKINIIVEACQSGSFINLESSVSGPNRVIIASTTPDNRAFASDNGAIFSDTFLDQVNAGASLYSAFQQAQWTANQAHSAQYAWMDDNGDGLYSDADGVQAQQRGFAFAGTFPTTQWPPYLRTAQIVAQGIKTSGLISVDVRDELGRNGIVSVYAVVYKPTYVSPDPSGLVFVQETLPTVVLLDPDRDGIYQGLYENFTGLGQYRIVIYAIDSDNLLARPVNLTYTAKHVLYLPSISKIPAVVNSPQP